MSDLECFNKTLVSTKACLQGYRLGWGYPLLACLLTVLFLAVASASSLNLSRNERFAEEMSEIQDGFTQVLQAQVPCSVEEGKMSCRETIRAFEAGKYTVHFLENSEADNVILFLEEGYGIRSNELTLESNYNFDFDFFQNYDPSSQIVAQLIVTLNRNTLASALFTEIVPSFCTVVILIGFISSLWTLLDRRKTKGQHSRMGWIKISLISMLNCAVIASLLSMVVMPKSNWAAAGFILLTLMKNGWMLKQYVAQHAVTQK